MHYIHLPQVLTQQIKHLEVEARKLQLLQLVYPLLDEIRTSTRHAVEGQNLPNLAHLKVNWLTTQTRRVIERDQVVNDLTRLI